MKNEGALVTFSAGRVYNHRVELGRATHTRAQANRPAPCHLVQCDLPSSLFSLAHPPPLAFALGNCIYF